MRKTWTCLYSLLVLVVLTEAAEIGKDQVDKVIEDEITQKLGEDLLQSLERKFQVDLQKSVDMVLLKIKLLLKNGTTHIQDRLAELQDILATVKQHGEKELEVCLTNKENETIALAEKALHQMVVCGYALIGHDPAQAVHNVMELKNMIRQGIKPLHDDKTEVYELLRVCGHDHDTLKKVIKCVISKSPKMKSTMMDVTGKLIDGIVTLTKLMAHGAMHEACLIEVLRSVEDEAFELIKDIRKCAYANSTFSAEVRDYVRQNNATILDVPNMKKVKAILKENKENGKDMKEILRRMLASNKAQVLESNFKNKLKKFNEEMSNLDVNQIAKSKKD